MSVHWLQPVAWWGLAALAVPILIHLLARQQSRRLLFPSLRFLRTTAVASWRRRVISDWPLLIVRVLVLAATVAALATPVALTDARRARWQQRIARAVVVSTGAEAPAASTAAAAVSDIVGRERESSTFTATFADGARLADRLRDAVAWLQTQPPAAREIVVVGEMRRGALTGGDLALVPAEVGVRFNALPIAEASVPVTLAAVADSGDGGTRAYQLRVTPGDRVTDVVYEPGLSAGAWLAVQAPAADLRYAEAARAATLAEGLVNDRPAERRVTVVFPGEGTLRAADLSAPAPGSWMRDTLERLADLSGGERQGRLVVVADMPATDPAAVDLVARVARTALETSRVALEPLPIASDRLAEWTRPPGPADVDAAPRDEGDGRWLWGAALALLGVEQWLRRQRGSRSATVLPDEREVRVA